VDISREFYEEGMMPYEIVRKGSKWCVVNIDTGESTGCSDSKKDAVAHQRVLYGVHHGWKPTGKKKD